MKQAPRARKAQPQADSAPRRSHIGAGQGRRGESPGRPAEESAGLERRRGARRRRKPFRIEQDRRSTAEPTLRRRLARCARASLAASSRWRPELGGASSSGSKSWSNSAPRARAVMGSVLRASASRFWLSESTNRATDFASTALSVDASSAVNPKSSAALSGRAKNSRRNAACVNSLPSRACVWPSDFRAASGSGEHSSRYRGASEIASSRLGVMRLQDGPRAVDLGEQFFEGRQVFVAFQHRALDWRARRDALEQRPDFPGGRAVVAVDQGAVPPASAGVMDLHNAVPRPAFEPRVDVRRHD